MQSSQITVLLFALLVPCAEIAAQGSASDYQRAAQLTQRFADKVFRQDLQETWLEDGRLVYSVYSGSGEFELILVDPSAAPGERRRMLLGKDRLQPLFAPPNEWMQVARVALRDQDTLLLLFEQKTACFLYSLVDDKLQEVALEDAVELHQQPRRPMFKSAPGQKISAMIFDNPGDKAVEIRLLRKNGVPMFYARLEPHAQRWVRTQSGNAWSVQEIDGGSRMDFLTEDQPGIARFDLRQELLPAPARHSAQPASVAQINHRVVFVRDHNLWLLGDEGEEAARLTSEGHASHSFRENLRWSPDGKAFVAVQVEEGQRREVAVVESAPKNQVQPVLHKYHYRKPGDKIDHPRPRLFRFHDPDKVEQVPVDDRLFLHPWSMSHYSWSSDSRYFRFLFNQRGHQILRWIEIDTYSGEARVLIEESSPTFIDYSSKLFLHVLEARGEAIWMSERSGWNHLYLIDLNSGAVKRALTQGEWLVRAVEQVDEKAGRLLLRVQGVHPDQDPYHQHWAWLDLVSGDLTLLTTGDGSHTLRWSPDRRFFLDRYSRVDLPPVTELRRADGSLVAELERGDASALIGAGWQTPQRFVAKGRDGATDIWGVVYRPTNFDAQGSYPVIESIYAGPHGAHVPKTFRAMRKQLELAELGFVVVQIDGMGTNWRSKAFHDVAWKNLKDAGFPDRVKWIQALAATDPTLDLDRVGIYGGSAGGQNAMRALIDHHDFYRAAVADCGCHDNRMDKIWWNEQWMGLPVDQSYSDSSNVEHAHRMQGDLLLVVGELDRNVDPASTMQVVNALIRADKDFELLVVPGGGHGIAEKPYGTRRRRDFFVRKLLKVEPRW